jgi:hypothetical protein
MSEQQGEINLFVVRAGSYDEMHTVYRFSGTERGKARANEYAEAFNESLRKAMGLTKAELELATPDHRQRPEEYQRALIAEAYRAHSALVVTRTEVAVIGDDDPMPTDYPHDF